MRRIWYLKEEEGQDIKAVKLFLYEKNGCICGKMDLSAFRERADKSKEDILLMMKNAGNLEIGTVNLSEETAAKEAYLCGRGHIKEELAQKIAMEKGEIYLSVTIGMVRYLSDGWQEELIENRIEEAERQEAVTGRKPEELPKTDTIEEIGKSPELEAEELLEEETAGKRIVQLPTLEEELLFREYVHNSFLLHGYYNYGHIIIDETEEEPRLGVPGNYYEREQMVAAMFGFPDFEPAKEGEKTGNGTYGYYYTRRKR
ncbi:MAG: hypothetical protein HDR00_11640 [Lachnospiraceae bacterium]|nr:hypothetical protein [Lachnospiraceae bacterium]